MRNNSRKIRAALAGASALILYACHSTPALAYSGDTAALYGTYEQAGDEISEETGGSSVPAGYPEASKGSAAGTGSVPVPVTDGGAGEEAGGGAAGEPNPFTDPGNGTLQDDAKEEEGKHFYTIKTKDGNTFYLIIDEQRTGDNVYMTSLVDEETLLSFVKDHQADLSEGLFPVPEEIKVPEPKPEPKEEDEEPETARASSGPGPIVFLFPALTAAGAGIYYYLRFVRGTPHPEEYEADDSYLDEDDARGTAEGE